MSVNIQFVLGFNNVDVRRSLASALANDGYSNILVCGTRNKVLSYILQYQVDVLVCDANLDGKDMTSLVYNVRHQEIGRNPFMMVFMASESRDIEVIRRIVNAGVDAVMVTPVVVSNILKIINVLKQDRKDWEVTAQYVGPSRRGKNQPEAEQAPLTRVPNTLKYKLSANPTEARLLKIIGDFSIEINMQKTTSQVIEIDQVVGQICKASADPSQSQSLVTFAKRLKGTAQNLLHRLGRYSGRDQGLDDTLGKIVATAEQMIAGQAVDYATVLKDLDKALNTGIESLSAQGFRPLNALGSQSAVLPLDEPSTADPAATEQGAEGVNAGSATDLFANLNWLTIKLHFEVLQNPLSQDGAPLPFILSEAFRVRFEALVFKHILPKMAHKCQGFIMRTDEEPEDKQAAYLQNLIEEPKNISFLWAAWESSWDAMTIEQPLPPKPADPKLISKLTKGSTKTALEEWSDTVRKINASNAAVKSFIAELVQDTGEYLPPQLEYLAVLRGLYARSNKMLQNQISSIHQIADQGGNIGTTYDLYQKGKELDLAFLAVCYHFPDTFQNLEKRIIKTMLAGTPKEERRKTMPLTDHYLSAFL